MLELRAVDGAAVLYADEWAVASSLDELLAVLPELAGQTSLSEMRWLGQVAILLASRMSQWPSRYAISKYIDELAPALSRELSTAFHKGREDAFDILREVPASQTTLDSLFVRLAERVAGEAPDNSA